MRIFYIPGRYMIFIYLYKGRCDYYFLLMAVNTISQVFTFHPQNVCW